MFIILVGCKNEEIVDDNQIFNLYCFKEYDKYEEYISIEYNRNDISYLGFSYVFDYEIKDSMNKIDLDKYKTMNLKYDDFSLDFHYDNVGDYISLKEQLKELLKLREDKFNYIVDGKIEYDLLRNYLEDYLCK